MKFKGIDVLVLVILIVLQNILVYFHVSNLLRASIGFLVVAFIPGYLLLNLLFDYPLDNGRFLQSLLLSIPVSLALVILVGMLEFWLIPDQINDLIQTIVLSIICLLFASLSFIKSRHVQELPHKQLFFILISILLISISIPKIAYSISEQETDKFSFYILDVNGTSNDQSYTIERNTPVNIHLGGDYKLHDSILITIRSSTEQEKQVQIIPPSGSWDIYFTETFNEIGSYQISWELSGHQSTDLSRFVSMWINVK